MGAFDSLDPFTQCEALIIATLEGDTAWAALVKAANRLWRTGTARSVRRPGEITGDEPSVDLMPAGFEVEGWTSSGLVCQQTFELRIRSGDLRPKQAMFPLRFATIRVLHALRVKPDATKTWLTAVEFWAADDEVAGGTRQLAGWTTALAIMCKMTIQSTDLV